MKKNNFFINGHYFSYMIAILVKFSSIKFMENILSNKFGCSIIERGKKFFMRYDSGDFASKMVESEITKEEAAKALVSEKDALEVILKGTTKKMQDMIFIKMLAFF